MNELASGSSGSSGYAGDVAAPAETGNVYDALTEQHGLDGHWAFGTGFDTVGAEFAEVTAPVPAGATADDVAAYCLMLGDDALIYSHRLTQWISNSPELEEEVALGNIALDLLGQARPLLSRAGQLAGAGQDEDALAFWRTEAQFRNVALAEVDDELDFARCIARLLVFATWRLALLVRLETSGDPVVAAVAAKGVKEVAYHRDYAVRWTLRLGDGTELSHVRMQAALDWVWTYVAELFRAGDTERRLAAAGVGIDPVEVRAEFDDVLEQVLTRATLRVPDRPGAGPIGGCAGRDGLHTEALGHVLAEMQSLARQHPGATW